MGSRKRKPDVKPRLIDVYKQLSIHERINFKTWEYWHSRIQLASLKKFKQPATVMSLQHFADLGIFHFLIKPII